MFGRLRGEKNGNSSWFDCSNSVQPIPGDFADDGTYTLHSNARQKRLIRRSYNHFLRPQLFRNEWESALDRICMHACRFIVIVHSIAIYRRLVEDGFPEQAQAIIVMAKGMPDPVTRAFLRHLTSIMAHVPFLAGCCAAPHHTCFRPLRPCISVGGCMCLYQDCLSIRRMRHSVCAVVNWAPSGAHLYSFVKYGGNAGQVSQQHAVPSLGRLAIRASMLYSMPYLTLQVWASGAHCSL